MQQIFIANPKGGCGKTTVSTHIAAFLANKGERVLLVDHDAQKSSTDWLKGRPESCAKIHSVAVGVGENFDSNGMDWLVHDMPAAWSLDHVEKFIYEKDKILIPVLSSPIDIKACLRFVMGLHRSGVLEADVTVGLIANRARRNTRYFTILQEFLHRLDLPIVGDIRDTQNYVRTMDGGVSIFDLPNARLKADIDEWQPVIKWLEG